MNIVMTGGTGFVGKHLTQALSQLGNQVVNIDRYDLNTGADSLVKLMSGADVVINLAGAPIDQRWTPACKHEIFSSRVDTTQQLVKAMAEVETPPKMFISTSAIGAFDSKGWYSESDPPNASDFLGQLSKQ
jgi:NAD dependent epimerase/dehydratase family enzyme